MATEWVYSTADADALHTAVSAGALQQRSLRALLPLLNATAANLPASVLTLGNDIAEGAGASRHDNSWTQLLKTYLRQAFGVTTADTGYGYIPAYNLSGDTTLVSISGASGTDYLPVTSEGGFGARSVTLATSGATITYAPQACRYLTVHATNSPSAAGSFVVTVDGVDKQTITTTADQPATENVTTIDMGSVATRAVTIRPASGTPRVEGVTFATAQSGITWLQGGHTGWRADQTLGTPARMHGLLLQSYPVALTVLQFGLNDMAGTGTAAISGAQFAASLKSLVDTLLAANPTMGVIVLHDAMRLEDARSAPAVGGQSNYPGKLVEFQEAVRSALGGYERVSILTLDDVWRPLAGGSQAAQDPLGWLTDGSHPGDVGHNQIATYLTARITGNQVSSAVEAKALAQQALNTAQQSTAPADTQMANLASTPTSAFRTELDTIYQPKAATSLDQQVAALVGSTSTSQAAWDSRYAQNTNLTGLLNWFAQDIHYGTAKFTIAQTSTSPANGSRAPYPVIGTLSGLAPGDTTYGLNLKRGRVNFRLDFIYQGATLTTNSDGNVADLVLGNITDPTLCPARTIQFWLYRNGVMAAGGRVETDGTVLLVHGTFAGQQIAYGTEWRFDFDWEWQGTF